MPSVPPNIYNLPYKYTIELPNIRLLCSANILLTLDLILNTYNVLHPLPPKMYIFYSNAVTACATLAYFSNPITRIVCSALS